MKKRSLGEIIVEGRNYSELKEMSRAADRESSIVFMICITALVVVLSVCMLIEWTWETAGMTEEWPGMNDAPMILLSIVSFMLGSIISYAPISGKIRRTISKMCDEAFDYDENGDEEEPKTSDDGNEETSEISIDVEDKDEDAS